MNPTKIFLIAILFLVAMLFTACGQQSAIPEGAVLTITGSVDSEIGWLEEDIRSMETVDTVSENSKGESETYTGVPINSLLKLAGPKSNATTLVFIADDGTKGEASLVDIQNCSDCIFSFRNNGGFSVIAPGFGKDAQIKGVVEVQVK